MPKKTKSAAAELSNPDILWGAEEIGRAIRRTPTQVYHLHATGKLGGAVRKLGYRTLVGSRRALAELLPGASAPIATP